MKTNGVQKKPNRVEAVAKRGARQANLELLRCVAMMMVIVLHYLGKGKILSDLTGPKLSGAETVAWILECLCIVAVNAYMLISGYFIGTTTFRLSRLIKLYLQLWFYSVGVGIIGILTGVLPMQEVEIHDLLTFVFPVSMGHYWFVTAYIFMYLFLPFIGKAVQQMTQKQMQWALGLLLFFFGTLKSVLPIRLEMDGQGYDCIWYLCVFLTAAYIRRFGSSLISNWKKSACVYVGLCLVIFGVTMGLRQVYLHTGSLGRIIKISLEYNHILPYLASVGLFGIFLNIKVPEKIGRVINRIAPYTLGVYLIHENITLRYAWQNWLGADKVDSIGTLLLWTVTAIAVVFAVGILTDMLRAALMKELRVLLNKTGIYRKALAWIEEKDCMFRGE